MSSPVFCVMVLFPPQVLRNDVLSHHATVETVNGAGAELLESSPGDEASHLRDQLDQLNQSWESLLLKTQERQQLLEAALQQVPGGDSSHRRFSRRIVSRRENDPTFVCRLKVSMASWRSSFSG